MAEPDLTDYRGLPGILKFIADRGLGVALAVGLTFFVTWTVSRNLTGLIEQTQALHIDGERNALLLSESQATIIKNQTIIVEILKEHEQQSRTAERLLYAMCVNSAPTTEARNRCTDQVLAATRGNDK